MDKLDKKLLAFTTFTAFTLAEVIVVIGILGIVAEMTIPGLIVNTNKIIYVTKLKKAYITMNEALMKYTTDQECGNDFACTDAGSGALENTPDPDTGCIGSCTDVLFASKLVKYFKTSKICGKEKNKGCMGHEYSSNYDGSTLKIGDGHYVYMQDSRGIYSFITIDKISYQLYVYPCRNLPAYSETKFLKQECGIVYIDINGPDAPNVFGRDMFVFTLSNGHGVLLYLTEDEKTISVWVS